MKKLILALTSVVLFAGSAAYAEYQKLAECSGRTEKRMGVRAVLFVNKSQDTLGYVAVQIEKGSDYLSATQISWNSNPQGYPRFFDNDFDLDIVISDKTPSVDDALVGQDYIGQLQCTYKL
jgi:hypothetical protein